MNDLQVRNISFSFDGVDFIWNPRNPAFSLFANIFSFHTIGFERFICKSMQECMPLLRSESLKNEIADFKLQEMAHSKAHLAHARALIARYPKLQLALDESIADFDSKWEASSMEYRIAYSAIVEATSFPLYRDVLKYRHLILEGGDSRVASLFLWHFTEEIEHRSSALKVYHEMIGKPFYRMKIFGDVSSHLSENMKRIGEHFNTQIPGASAIDMRQAMANLPTMAKLRMALGLLSALMPFYRPAKLKAPDYCRQWNELYRSGVDMRDAPF